MGKSRKVKKLGKKQQLIIRAEKLWRLVHFEEYSYTDAWKKVVPVSKAKKVNWGILARRACDLFEKTYGKDLQKLLEAAGLGLPRVAEEVSKSLDQKKVELYKGEIVSDEDGNPILFEDNVIQQKGRELLTKIHGLGANAPVTVPIVIEIVNPDKDMANEKTIPSRASKAESGAKKKAKRKTERKVSHKKVKG